MYYIRYKKPSSKHINETMHVADSNGITELTNFIMTSFLKGIKRDKLRNLEHPSYSAIPKLWDKINPCKSWLSNKIKIQFVDDRYGKSKNLAECDNTNSSLDNEGKIQDSVITVYMSADILTMSDEDFKEYIDDTADTIQHELTHAYSEWFQMNKQLNGNKINKLSNQKHHKLQYWDAYSEMVDMMEAADDVDYPKDLSDIDNWILQIKSLFGKVMYKCCEEERASYRAGYYQQLLTIKKEADELGEQMEPITSIKGYKELIDLYKDGLKAIKTAITARKIAEAREQAMKEIIPIFESIFNVSNATPQKMYNTFKKIIEKEIYKYRKLYGVVKTYGKIPTEEK